jgi:hypothetical protein
MHRTTIVVSLTVLSSVASVCAFGADVKGMIISRTGETLIVKSAQGNVTVVLTDSTTVGWCLKSWSTRASSVASDTLSAAAGHVHSLLLEGSHVGRFAAGGSFSRAECRFVLPAEISWRASASNSGTVEFFSRVLQIRFKRREGYVPAQCA